MSDTSPATRESVVAEMIAESMAEQAQAPEQKTEPPVEQAAESAETETPQDGDQPSDLEAPEAASDEAGEGEEPEAPAIEAPQFWSAEAKARFGELPPDLQLLVLENEKAASKATTLKLEEAALSKKAADAEAARLKSVADRIAEAAEKAEAGYRDRWAGMTPAVWQKLHDDNPSQYWTLKAAFDAETAQIQQTQSAKEEAETASYTAWVAEQQEALKTLSPELVDPVKGPERIKALAAYLVANGVKEQDLPNVGALEMAIAEKARKYDELQALKPAMKLAKPALRPAAATAVPSKQRAIEEARNRFAQTKSRADAHALMLLEEQIGN